MPRTALCVVGSANYNLLDLVELMNAIQTCSVFAGGASFAAKACGCGDIFQWQRFQRNDFISMQSHQSDFACSREKQIMIASTLGFFKVICLLSACGEKTSANHAFLADDDGNSHWLKTALIRHEIKRISNDRMMQSHPKSSQHIVPCSRHLDSAFKVNQSE